MALELGANSDSDPMEDPPLHRVACTQCRKKKQRCSKGNPCQTCAVTGNLCVYEETQRRGAKAGYIDALNQRMDTLEALVLGQVMILQPNIVTAQIQDENNGSLFNQQLRSIKEHLLNIDQTKGRKSNHGSPLSSGTLMPALSTIGQGPSRQAVTAIEPSDPQAILPPQEILNHLVTIYFEQIHPWIPILHEASFKAALQSSDDRPSVTILMAITVATINFHSSVDNDTREWYQRRCHDAVVLASMDRFSVENLQATIIIAFNTVGSGKGPRSWSIVASAARVVEQLGLAVELEDFESNKLLNRIGFLSLPRNWIEGESMRRVFWCIFLMDRFCSVTTGWNPSLTSNDVKRRLPVSGELWRDNIPRRARYFNIADQNLDSRDEADALGGFAYLVEATACLSHVATFLRQAVDFSAWDGLRRWFDTFLALDAMLVRWKTFLPPRWQVARHIDSQGNIDQNLTLAHITHNTSVIMLHQNIAYPDATRSFHTHLPWRDAAKTCLSAATEIATIAAKLLSCTAGIVSPNFAFCLFVAGRALLAHAKHLEAPIDPSFEILVSALLDASTRWIANSRSSPSENLAGQFADRLNTALLSKSTLNVRSAALADHEEMISAPHVSLSSPPFPDVFRYEINPELSSLPKSQVLGDEIGLSDIYGFSETHNRENLDRIFSWTDNMVEHGGLVYS